MSNTPWYLDALKQGIEAAENMNTHPDLKQAAIDQGIRPAGYDAPITGWSQLTTDQLFDLHKGIHDRAVKDTVDKVLEIIEELKEMEDGLEERANSIGFIHHTPTGNVKDVEHIVTPRNPNEIKVVKLNAKADGIQYAREYVRKKVMALKEGEQE